MYSSVAMRLVAGAILVVTAALAYAVEPCAPATRASGWRPPVVVAGDSIATLDEIRAPVGVRRAVFVGESHDRFDHHLNQLEVVCRLHARGRPVAIGMEMFQRPFQRHLDDFVAGQIDLDTLLLRSGYFDRWRYDPRLYAPILEFAREHAIPLVALNVDSDILRAVARGGFEALDDEDRARLPSRLAQEPESYRRRLRAVFERHPAGPHRSLENFQASQVLWDETMAETTARFLDANPEHTMVVLAGNGHIAWRDGIPARVERRTGERGVVVVNESPGRGADPASADYLLLSEPLELARAGLMGVFLEDDGDGLRVAQVSEGGAAEAAGIQAGDHIERVDGVPVSRFAEVKSKLWRRPAGASARIGVRAPTGASREVVMTLR